MDIQVTAKFEMPGIKKQDVHVSFQRTRLVVTWQTVTTNEREEDGHIIRERQEKTYSQNIPLPEGARVSEETCSILRPCSLSVISSSRFALRWMAES
jgi:HSP20 family molecular chaperone IbpA